MNGIVTGTFISNCGLIHYLIYHLQSKIKVEINACHLIIWQTVEVCGEFVPNEITRIVHP